jgi:hypothetical protein
MEATFGDGEGMYVDSVINLSLGGACVECRKPIDKGKKITLIIPSNPREALELISLAKTTSS